MLAPDRLFAYGTLMAPELLCAVVGRHLGSTNATLAGYACYRVRRAAYPAIVPEPEASTAGRVYSGLTLEEWDRLDEFESFLYDRETVGVATEQNSQLEVQTYVFKPEYRDRLTDDPWDFEEFRAHALGRYLKRLPT